MLSNTGNLAFVLYGILIVVALIGSYAAIRIMIRTQIDEKKAALIIDLFKWAIVTVGITTTGFIVANLFKEREQDLKELEYFDNYVEDVKKADGIEERIRLVKYLCIVSPGGEIKKSWQEYYQVISKEYDEYLALKAQQNTGDSLMGLTVNERIKSIENQAKLDAFERPLVRTSEQTRKPTIFIQYCDRGNQAQMMNIRNKFLDNSWNAPGIELVKEGCDSSIRYFHEEDRDLANQANTLLDNRYVIKKVNLSAPRGQIELWFGD